MRSSVTKTDIQVAVENETQSGTDSIYFTVEGDHVTISIEDMDGTEASFILCNDRAQQVFDFLKDKGVVT